MVTADYSFYLTELRTMKNMCRDDEEFLTMLSIMLGQSNDKITQLEHDLGLAEEKIRQLDGEVADASWATNPDRMGGAFTDQEIADSTGWK